MLARKNSRRNFRHDNRGMTTIDAVTTIFLMTIILPVFIGMISSALNTREVATSLSANTINVASVQKILNNDIETASAIKIVDGNVLNMRSQDGVCKSWKLKNGDIVRATSDEAITENDTWVSVGQYFKPIGADDLFKKSSSGIIGYNFEVGEKTTVNELRGSATQKAASTGAGDCW